VRGVAEVQCFNLASTYCARVEKEKIMKLVLRILPTVFVLISITAFADVTVRNNLDANIGIEPNLGAGDNWSVSLFGQGVFIQAIGGTPLGFFDGPYFPGDMALGPTTIFWDVAGLQIGSTGYDFSQFDLFPDDEPDFPFVTFPTNGKDVTVRVPFVPFLFGTIISDCPSSGCDFAFVGKPGTLSFSFTFDPESFGGAYFASSASFSVPEPGTLGLMAAGLAGILAVFKRRKRPAVLPHSQHS